MSTGVCPICFEDIVSTERSPTGYSICKNSHKVKNCDVINEFDDYYSENNKKQKYCLKPNTLVRHIDDERGYKCDKFLYLGEIANMIGYCSIINIKTNEIDIDYHINDFVPLEDEFI